MTVQTRAYPGTAPGRRPTGDVVARVRGLRFAYGAGRGEALRGVDLDVRAGEVLLVEGPSGGGKSTLLRALAGLVPHFHGGTIGGRAEVAGVDVTDAGPAAASRVAGMVFQDPEAQAVMGTVDRDVAFGLQNAGLSAGAIPGEVARALEQAGAGHLAGRAIATLSAGERQRVAIAGVLARRPALLLLDEPTSQLDPAAAAHLAALLREVADAEGVAVVVAEHRSEGLREVADRRIAVREGLVAEPAPPPVPVPPAPVRPGPPALTAERIRAGYGPCDVVDGASLTLAAGTVTALSGPNGSGKSTLLRALAGIHAVRAGRVRAGDRDLTGLPAERRFPTVALVPQDPGRHLLCERVEDEVALALGATGVPPAERPGRAAAAMADLEVAALAGRHPGDLSVGERERVALAAVLVADPAVILLDEPTRGMDPRRRAALAALLRARAASGAAVLVATHDRAFAAACADRHLEMREGRPI